MTRHKLRKTALPAATSTYMRQKDLPSLIPLWPWEITDNSLAGRLKLLATLRKALRAERSRGLRGHWSYDLARHRALLAAYRHETKEAVLAHRNRRFLKPFTS